MNRTKLIATLSLAVVAITMITSNQLPGYASPTTEDDGYTYPDDATEEEKRELDEREQESDNKIQADRMSRLWICGTIVGESELG